MLPKLSTLSFPRNSPPFHSLFPSDSSQNAIVCWLLLVNFTHFYILDALKMSLTEPPKMPLTVPPEHTLSEVEFQLGRVLHSDYC